MSSISDTVSSVLSSSSLLGVARSLSVHTLIYPFEVIKLVQQQPGNDEKIHEVTARIFRSDGFSAFYRGFNAQLAKSCLKQIWSWPMIVNMPGFWSRCGASDTAQMALTGLSISFVDSVTTPLERAKILSAIGKRDMLLWRDIYKAGWRGIGAHVSHSSVSWVTFLVAQKHFRDKERGADTKDLSFLSLVETGVKVAFVVSVVKAPFDVINTMKQSSADVVLAKFFSEKAVQKLYRGWPLSAASLVIQNIASVTLIEALRKRSSEQLM